MSLECLDLYFGCLDLRKWRQGWARDAPVDFWSLQGSTGESLEDQEESKVEKFISLEQAMTENTRKSYQILENVENSRKS